MLPCYFWLCTHVLLLAVLREPTMWDVEMDSELAACKAKTLPAETVTLVPVPEIIIDIPFWKLLRFKAFLSSSWVLWPNICINARAQSLLLSKKMTYLAYSLFSIAEYVSTYGLFWEVCLISRLVLPDTLLLSDLSDSTCWLEAAISLCGKVFFGAGAIA